MMCTEQDCYTAYRCMTSQSRDMEDLTHVWQPSILHIINFSWPTVVLCLVYLRTQGRELSLLLSTTKFSIFFFFQYGIRRNNLWATKTKKVVPSPHWLMRSCVWNHFFFWPTQHFHLYFKQTLHFGQMWAPSHLLNATVSCKKVT